MFFLNKIFREIISLPVVVCSFIDNISSHGLETQRVLPMMAYTQRYVYNGYI